MTTPTPPSPADHTTGDGELDNNASGRPLRRRADGSWELVPLARLAVAA